MKPAADGLMKMYLESIGASTEGCDTQDMISQGTEGTELVLKYIYDNFDVFKLIFCNSAGTEYEGYFDGLAQIEEKYYKKFVKQFSRRENTVSDFFIHVICRTGWSYIYEVVSHDIPYDEAKIFMGDISKYCYAGWKCVLGVEDMP